MKKFYRIFVVSGIYIGATDEYSGWHQYSEGVAITPYHPQLFESEQEAEEYLEKVVPNDKEYKNCQFTIQKVYMYNN